MNRTTNSAWRACLALYAFFVLTLSASAVENGSHTEPNRIGLATGTLIIPTDFAPDENGAVNILMTMHCFERGVQEFTDWNEPHWVLISVHKPGFSSVYRRMFERPALFGELLDEAMGTLAARFSYDSLHEADVWIAAFSAGYAGAREILSDDEGYRRLDGLILLDCPHTGYTEDREVVPEQMAGFTRFAHDAAAGDKRFLMTHSEIFPGDYSSTTECADYLLAQLGLERSPMHGVNDEGMTALSQAVSGNFRVYGFAGDEAPHHMQHLYSLEQWLRDDWTWTINEGTTNEDTNAGP